MTQAVTNPNTQQYWDEVYRREWEQGLVGTDRYRRDYGPIHDAVIALIDDAARVLDLGCGPGLLCRRIKLARPRTRVTGVDFSPYAIEQTGARDAQLGITYHCRDLRTTLDGIGGPFDVITLCEVLEHLDEPERVVAAAMTCLRPGGLFIITCPHDDAIPDVEHVRIWGHDSLFHLLAGYGDVVSFRHFPPPYFHHWTMAWTTRVKRDGVE
jgi:2-polyprenyl-3-methyl-5-hydroxy-6-metoxy-1,4-benzoquinol methylase